MRRDLTLSTATATRTTGAAGTPLAGPPAMPSKLSQVHVWPLLKQTSSEWSEDKAPKMAASLAFYTATSIAPMVIAGIGIFTLVVHKHVDPKQLHDMLARQTDPSVADTLQSVVDKAATGHSGLVATVLGIVIATFSASAVFAELQDSLNTIWEVRPKPNRGIWGMVQDRFLSIGMVLVIAFLLLVSTVLTTLLASVSGGVFGGMLGTAVVAKSIVGVVTFIITTGVVGVLFATMFKVLPDVKVAWRDVWIGGLLTSLLFQVGKYGLSLYISKAAPGSAFGALGSVVVMLIWVDYSAYILFFGAELTQVYANQYGSRAVPSANAEPLTEEMRRQAGMPHAADSASHPDRQRGGRAGGGPVRPTAVPGGPSASAPRGTPLIPTTADVVRRRAPLAPPRPSKLGLRLVVSGLPVATAVVVGRLAWRRYHAAKVHGPEIRADWQAVAQKWTTLAKLFVSKSRDRYAMTHGPSGRAGPTWAELAPEKVEQA